MADFFLTKQRELAKREAEMRFSCTMNQIVPVGESKTTTSLTTMLGQYSIPPMEFHKRFDANTQMWNKGVLVPVKVKKKLRSNEFDLTVKTVSFPFVVDTARFDDSNTASAFVLYDVIRFKVDELKKQPRHVARLVFSTLHCFHVKRLLWKQKDNPIEDTD